MKVSAEIFNIQLKYPFRIARRKPPDNRTVVINIEHEGVIGLGEAKPSAYYYGETREKVLETISNAQDFLGNDGSKPVAPRARGADLQGRVPFARLPSGSFSNPGGFFPRRKAYSGSPEKNRTRWSWLSRASS